MEKGFESSQALAASITWTASKQTYYTIRFLVDRERVPDAYRTYAYFRWVDDRVDQELSTATERIAFVERQNALVECLYRRETPTSLSDEERLLADLVYGDREPNSGLQAYIRNMMAVMIFDAYRRGRLISQKELGEYSGWLAMAVTEAMHYFIGHGCATPCTETRYLAVTAAHIIHMLRDTREDTVAGYVNIPREFLEAHGIAAGDLDRPAYRMWVKSRVQLARDYFTAGERYLAQVKNLRCRLAGYAYIARFTVELDSIQRNGYRLPAGTNERKHLGARLRMGWSVFVMALSSFLPGFELRSG